MKITIEGLQKQYSNGFYALRDVNLEIESGMFGLLGPNGAGKSTLMRILVTLLAPTAGQVMVNGKPLDKNRKYVRSLLGYLPQDFRFFSKLRTCEFLDYSARLAGVKGSRNRANQVDEMLEKVGLYEVRDRMANKLSGGMKRRLGIAQALIGEPRIIIVDEPTTGLDPEERIRFRNLLTAIGENGTIIILSTHIVGDISSTCRDMALLNKGQVAFRGAPDELIEKAKGHVWQMQVTQSEYEVLKERYPVISTIPNAGGWLIQLVAQNGEFKNGTPVDPNLEHAYVYYMESVLGETSDLEVEDLSLMK